MLEPAPDALSIIFCVIRKGVFYDPSYSRRSPGLATRKYTLPLRPATPILRLEFEAVGIISVRLHFFGCLVAAGYHFHPFERQSGGSA